MAPSNSAESMCAHPCCEFSLWAHRLSVTHCGGDGNDGLASVALGSFEDPGAACRPINPLLTLLMRLFGLGEAKHREQILQLLLFAGEVHLFLVLDLEQLCLLLLPVL